mmetsp:Transcript_81411/g.143735  ORF Transcript_81411/g.143735 Transcript_81411/m.143735 type:complete len:339 (+) Transcript_81411:87-1103(+)
MLRFACFGAFFATSTAAYKILLYWAVDSNPETQAKVKANVEYAKSIPQGGDDCCDVMLWHYKGKPEEWKDQVWYSKTVVRNHSSAGFKFKGLKLMYEDKNYTEKWVDKYEWVWALDSDVDFTQVNLARLFELCRKSGAMIVSPTFLGDAAQWTEFNMNLQGMDLRQQENHKKHAHNEHAVNAIAADGTVRETDFGEDENAIATQINVIGKPNKNCQFRHTTYVEMTAPLLHGKVLSALFENCDKCIGENAEWGLDRIWCRHAKKTMGNSKPCAYIDETPVLHLDWRTAAVNGEFKKSEQIVRDTHGDEFARIEVVDCVSRSGTLPSAPSPPVAEVALR